MYAVIKTGGKQYKVAKDDVVKVEKLPGDAGSTVEFSDVLLVSDGESITVGSPLVKGATVTAELLEQTRGPKIIIFKKKRRQSYRRKNGHRQDLTALRITDILTGGAKPKKATKSKAKAAPKKAAAKTDEAPAEAPAAEQE